MCIHVHRLQVRRTNDQLTNATRSHHTPKRHVYRQRTNKHSVNRWMKFTTCTVLTLTLWSGECCAATLSLCDETRRGDTQHTHTLLTYSNCSLFTLTVVVVLSPLAMKSRPQGSTARDVKCPSSPGKAKACRLCQPMRVLSFGEGRILGVLLHTIFGVHRGKVLVSLVIL
jgi:hypothetical protein